MIFRTATLCSFLLLFCLCGHAQQRESYVVDKHTVKLPLCVHPALQASQLIPARDGLAPVPEGIRNPSRTNVEQTQRLRRAANHDLFEVGLMANTYCMIGENRNQIACDPLSNQVAIVFRGNDRSDDGDGNTLYIRYSGDHGANWSDQGNNVATSSSPRYPNIFLHNTGSGAHTALLWPQVITFADASEDFGQVNSMKASIGNVNPSYGTLGSPPDWSIPWSIVMDQTNGDLYSAAEAVEPSNGNPTNEIFLLRSTDGGAQWAPVNLGMPFFEPNLIPGGHVGLNLRIDISPDGSTMIASWALIIETVPGSANLLDEDHEIAWRISTDKGVNWGSVQSLRIADITNRPSPFETKITQSWDHDVVLDYRNRPHFLTVCSADLNPFDPFDEALTDSTIDLRHVDSTFTTELTQDDQGAWHIVPIGPVRRLRIDRLSFTSASDVHDAYTFRNEPEWARSWDGTKIWAKWISPYYSWRVANVAGQATLFADTITQIYANGRHVDSPPGHPQPWTYAWDFATSDHNSPERDSLMRLTSLDDVAAKFTKLAYYAGDNGELHTLFVEWGVGDNLDDDPINTNQIVWYVKDVRIPVSLVDVERTDPAPAAFSLSQNFPNPFNPETVISFTLPKAMTIRLSVYDVLGRKISSLAQGWREAGSYRASFNASQLASGMYIYRLENGVTSTSKIMMLSR